MLFAKLPCGRGILLSPFESWGTEAERLRRLNDLPKPYTVSVMEQEIEPNSKLVSELEMFIQENW